MAGFNTAISGIRAATAALDVTGNNIANASTTGFKSSRTEFADIYATASIGSGASNSPGSGVLVADIAQDFSGGNVQFTNNNLDLSINGSGFFQLDDGRGSVTYTRDGSFELDKDGFIVSKGGQNLQGFGVDDLGNRLPIGDLQVSEKESPPKATETMGLSFNINEALDAESLTVPYSREDAASATFSTTVGTFDSLGNEHTIRYDMVEQQAKKEIHTFDQGVLGAFAGDEVTISGVDVDTGSATQFVIPGTLGRGEYVSVSAAKLQELQLADPRIFDVRFTPGLAVAGTDPAVQGSVQVIFESAARESGELIVGADTLAATPAADLLSNPKVTTLQSNETHKFTIPTGGGGTGATTTEIGSYVTPQQFSIAGVDFSFDATATSPITRQQVANEIISKETQIRDANPNIETIKYDTGTSELTFTFKAESGDVSNSSLDIAQADGNFFGGTVANTNTTPAVGATAAVIGAIQSTDIEKGDNSFEGVYRMYAYLNPLGQRPEALDIGKTVEPGSASDATTTEIGPIIVKFNPTNGILTSINDSDVPTTVGATVPKLNIKNADPADASTTITLDLTGTTQFADPQIVKSQSQDGYSKGDLTGVSFTATGDMIATFSNNQSKTLGIVAVATFENQAGMQPSGSTQWLATSASGGPVLNPPGSGLNGSLRSSALESSNVDLSAELVKLIESQRNFQASSKTLETLNTVTQNILQI
jgi:flagellar hook protein FlgE